MRGNFHDFVECLFADIPVYVSVTTCKMTRVLKVSQSKDLHAGPSMLLKKFDPSLKGGYIQRET